MVMPSYPPREASKKLKKKKNLRWKVWLQSEAEITQEGEGRARRAEVGETGRTGERGWVSMDRTSERFVLCLKGLEGFGRGEQGQNGKEANRVVKLEESNSSPLRIVQIVGDVKRLGCVGRSVWI